jgi:hypothetical protein
MIGVNKISSKDKKRCWVSTVYFEDGSNPPWIAVLSKSETQLLCQCVTPNMVYMSCHDDHKSAQKFKRKLLKHGDRQVITPSKLHKIARSKHAKH